MLSKPMTAITLAAFLATSTLAGIAPAAAAGFDGFPDMRYNPYGAHAQTRGTTAGAYIRMPFKGGLDRPREEARLGFALSTRFAGQYHDPGRFAARGTPRLIDLSLGLSGQRPLADSVRFNGMSLNQINALYADDDGEGGDGDEGGKKKKGGSALKTGLIIVGVVAVGLGIAVAVACSGNDEPGQGFENIGPC